MADYIPSREADLLTYAQTFSATLTASPGNYGALASDVTNLATLVASYDSALAAARDPATRTRSKIIEKSIVKNN